MLTPSHTRYFTVSSKGKFLFFITQTRNNHLATMGARHAGKMVISSSVFSNEDVPHFPPVSWKRPSKVDDL